MGCRSWSDPPYPKETRVTKDLYEDDEMTIEQHELMARAALKARAKITLSSYRNPWYDKWFKGWRTIEIDIANHCSRSREKKRKTEVLYLNY